MWEYAVKIPGFSQVITKFMAGSPALNIKETIAVPSILCFLSSHLSCSLHTLFFCLNHMYQFNFPLHYQHRISEEVVEAEQELIELQKHVSAQGILVQDLMSGVCRELDIWHKSSKEETVKEKDFQTELDEILSDDTQDPKVIFLDKLDVLLAEHKIEEALLALEAEEKKYLTADEPGKESNAEISAFKAALFKRKSILEDQLVRYSEQPSLSITQLRRSLSGLIKIEKSS
jgi:exocyst complex component 8